MSWIMSKAMMDKCANSHYSQELAAESLGENCSDGEQLPQLSVMPTPQRFWRNDKMMEFSIFSRFGLTYQLLTEQDGEAALTLFLADFPVKTYLLQEEGQESMEPEAGYGKNLFASFVKYDRKESTWKTHQHSLLGGLESYSETWPLSGMMRNGECWERQTLAGFTKEIECGFSLPTTGANEGKGASGKRYLGSTHFRGEKMSEGLRTCESDPKYLNPLFAELTMMWPLGMTDLKPLEMDRFQEWLQSHTKS